MHIAKLNNPILIAAWPGMGHVAATACYYLISKLKMEFHAEYVVSELFDVDHVNVESGLVQPFRYPKNQMFVWKNPNGGRDLMVFIGEAQPPQGRYNLCRKLIDIAQREGAAEVYTFAAMATGAIIGDEARVIGVATDKITLQLFVESGISLLSNGSVSGMNGILLGVAAERKIPGGCLLGELPASLVGVPYPRSAAAVLVAFSELTGIDVDIEDLDQEAQRLEKHVAELLDQLKLEYPTGDYSEPSEDTFLPDPMENGKLTPDEKDLVERMFEAAEDDRSEAFLLKSELDRLEVFREYEDRFLDLFRKDGE